MIGPADAAEIEAEFRAAEPTRVAGATSWEIFKKYRRGWVAGRRSPTPGQAAVRRLTALLRAALPDEDLELEDAEARLGDRGNDGAHIDAAYLTVTIALRGPGTLIYVPGPDGRLREIEAPAGQAAVITNFLRQDMTRVPGTIHSAPTPDRFSGDEREQRRLIVVRYARRGQPPLDAARFARTNEALRERVDASRGRRPKARGLFGSRSRWGE